MVVKKVDGAHLEGDAIEIMVIVKSGAVLTNLATKGKVGRESVGAANVALAKDVRGRKELV